MPVISSWHGEYFGTTIYQKLLAPFYNFLTVVLLKYFVRYIVTVSDFSRNILIKNGINNRKIKRIYNGIPSSHFIEKNITEFVVNYSTQIDKLVVGTICRLDVTKDLFTLLRAIQIITRTDDNIRLVIREDGPLKNKLIGFAKKLGISDYIYFAGLINKIQRCLMSIDIFVLHSKIENFSISLLEAMRACLPIIAINIGGNPEAVSHNINDSLVNPGNPENIAFTILKCQKIHISDRNLQKKLIDDLINILQAIVWSLKLLYGLWNVQKQLAKSN